MLGTFSAIAIVWLRKTPVTLCALLTLSRDLSDRINKIPANFHQVINCKAGSVLGHQIKINLCQLNAKYVAKRAAVQKNIVILLAFLFTSVWDVVHFLQISNSLNLRFRPKRSATMMLTGVWRPVPLAQGHSARPFHAARKSFFIREFQLIFF